MNDHTLQWSLHTGFTVLNIPKQMVITLLFPLGESGQNHISSPCHERQYDSVVVYIGFTALQAPKQMATYSQLFHWMNRVKETLYETKDYRGEPTPPTEAMFVNLVHYRAMPLQLRQVRIKPGELCCINWTNMGWLAFNQRADYGSYFSN